MTAGSRAIGVDSQSAVPGRTCAPGESPASGERRGDSVALRPVSPATPREVCGPATPCDAALITKKASAHSYYTIRFLVDRRRVTDAFRAYAYFRWVDDSLDLAGAERAKCLAFVERQRSLVDALYAAGPPGYLAPEEEMLAALIDGDPDRNSGLGSYIRNMMAVMEFDTRRRDRLISETELEAYSRHLSIAVTDALHYFIGHDDPVPVHEARYLPVIAAHITHMLRDTYDDNTVGYFNVPEDFLAPRGIGPWDVDSAAYREWVESRVRLAREYFALGKDYLAQVKSLRCRLAGYAYSAQFNRVLDAIERDGYRLRRDYRSCAGSPSRTRLIWSALSQAL